MLSTMRYTFLELVRTPGIMVWSLVFPIILMAIFSAMFSSLDGMTDLEPISVVVVDTPSSSASESTTENEADAIAFASFIDALSEGENHLLDTTYTSSPEQAEKLVVEAATSDDPFIGYVQLKDGKPDLWLSNALSAQSMAYTEAFIVSLAMDEYTAKSALVQDILTNNPQAMANPKIIRSVYETIDATLQVDVTRNQPKETVRYYFALLGMAALFGGTVSLVAFQRMRPNLSALGARRCVGALSHGRAVGATLLTCWVVNFLCLTVAYIVMRFVIGIDFAGRDGACLAVVAAASLTAMCLGCAVSSIPKIPENGKSGLLTGIVCFSALFAGLYGQPTMALADTIAANAPWVTWINPASQVSQAFYSIMYYDDITPLLTHIGALVIMSGVLFALAVNSLRRQQYASI